MAAITHGDSAKDRTPRKGAVYASFFAGVAFGGGSARDYASFPVNVGNWVGPKPTFTFRVTVT